MSSAAGMKDIYDEVTKPAEFVNYKIESAPDRRGKTHMVRADGDLNNMIKAFKAKVKKYYINNIVDTLFKYEFLK